ncbi:GGDEF domain-containing protein [Comamonas sp.]|uniref:sensor domain-containing diguanylate cyclase n=1 Tax=Comamonas sp. TaxID=34028 RepID=UPI0025C383E3|nr:GGDEF domain-containing protein [Comamonas sp.]
MRKLITEAHVRAAPKLMYPFVTNQGENVAMKKNSYLSSLSDSRPDTLPQMLQVAVEQAFNAVVITDAEMAGGGPFIRYCNNAFALMTGYAIEELLGRSPRMLQGPDTDPQVIEQMRQCLADGSFFQGSAVNYRKDGTPYHVSWNISAVRDTAGNIAHFVSVQQDVTRQVEGERQRDLMIQALNSANAPVFITDRKGSIVFVNHAFERQTGYSFAEAIGRTPAILHSGAHTAQFYSELRDALVRGDNISRTFINRRKDGELYHASQSISALRDARQRITHYVSVSKDISELVQREQALRVQALQDDLTGLLNRSAGRYELENCQRNAERQGLPYALILCDVDLFKQVNDQFGHEAGDRVLQQVAEVLGSCVRSSEHVARWGGEEFLIIVPGAGLQAALDLAHRLRLAIAAQSFAEVGCITLSFGVGCWEAGDACADLLRRTDMALYRAKNAGRNQVVCARRGPEQAHSRRSDA